MLRILAVGLFLVTTIITQARAEDVICNTKSTITNIRSGPGTEHAVAFTLGNMAVVETHETETDTKGRIWVKIGFREDGPLSEPEYGYVLISSVSSSCNEAALPKPTGEGWTSDSEKFAGIRFSATDNSAYVCNSKSESTNVRSGPSAKNFGVVGTLANGTKVTVEEVNTNTEGFTWMKISFTGESGNPQEGYVFNEALSANCDGEVLSSPNTVDPEIQKLQEKANQGNLDAAYRLYSRYVGVDQEKALEWLLHATLEGHALAQETYGRMKLLGANGVTKDEQEGAFWITSARAVNGDAEAQFKLGEKYTLGEGQAQNLAFAEHWFEKAAAQHYQPAIDMMIKIRHARLRQSELAQQEQPIQQDVSSSDAGLKSAGIVCDSDCIGLVSCDQTNLSLTSVPSGVYAEHSIQSERMDKWLISSTSSVTGRYEYTCSYVRDNNLVSCSGAFDVEEPNNLYTIIPDSVACEYTRIRAE